jgi:hypothetical protein
MSVYRTLIVAVVLLLPSLAAAKTTIYECNIKPERKTAWIPEIVRVMHDESNGEAFVIDPIIYHFNEKRPVPATIAVNNAKRTTYVWVVKGIKNSFGQYVTTFRFRGTYLKPSRTMVMTSSPDGYDDKFKGRGKCTVKVE